MSKNEERPVRASDKVSAVLARDEGLVEIFASHSPQFVRLRNPGMRRVMARLVSVEQAAKICGAEPGALVRELNAALGFAAEADGDPVEAPTGTAVAVSGAVDVQGGSHPWAPDAPITTVDVREDLKKGQEPFSKIMAAVAGLGDAGVLCLRATFEPVPLFAVMQKRGYAHIAEELGAEDWRVWFYPGAEPAARGRAAASASATDDAPVVAANASEVVLDVRGLEPPEPMQRTLEALTDLPDDAVLIQVNVRIPHFLLPMLKERGYDYEMHEPEEGKVVVRIWRVVTDPAA